MFNFIKCTGFITGGHNKRCIAFKSGEPNITVFMRKYDHSFMKCIDSESKEGVSCSMLNKYNSFVLTDDNHVYNYC